LNQLKKHDSAFSNKNERDKKEKESDFTNLFDIDKEVEASPRNSSPEREKPKPVFNIDMKDLKS
jgi:hypothetical protein